MASGPEITVRLSDGEEVLAVITAAMEAIRFMKRKDYLEAEHMMQHLEVALRRLAVQCSPELSRKIEHALAGGGEDAVSAVVP